MEFRNTVLLVKDIEKTKKFYSSLIGLKIIDDLGENVFFSGGLVAQTEKSWLQFTHTQTSKINYGSHDIELYFEEKDYFNFLKKVEKNRVEILSEMEMPYGQRVIRLYDPDKHIVEVGEEMGIMIRRLHKKGLSKVEISEKTGYSLNEVNKLLR